jgi:ABC-type sugar transport system, periplasmic component
LKKAGLALMAAIMVFMIAACSSNNSNSSSLSDSNKSGEGSAAALTKTKLLFWTFGRADLDYLKSRIDEFNKTNSDNIDVELVSMSENFKQSFEMAVTSKQAPDIFMPDPANFIEFAKKGYYEPLDNYMSSEMKQRYEPTEIEGLNTYGGKIYSLPNAGFTIRLVYNKDIFDKVGIANPPKTLKEMTDDAKKITEALSGEGIYGFALNFKNPSSAFERSGVRLAQAMGLGSYGYDLKQGKFNFGMYKDVVEAFKQMKDDGSMLPGVESLDIDPLRAQFAAGKIGMYISYAAEVGVYQSQFPTKVNWAAAQIPTVDGKINGAVGTNGGASWLEISSSSEKKEAAWKLFEFLQSDDTLVPYAEKGLGIPLAPGVSEKVHLTGDIYGLDYFLPTKYDAMWPVVPTGFLTVDGLKFADAFWKYILTGGNWDDVVKDLNDRYNSALEKAISSGEIKDMKDPSFDASKLQGTLSQ